MNCVSSFKWKKANISARSVMKTLRLFSLSFSRPRIHYRDLPPLPPPKKVSFT